uniref:Uncharacterized protein n=1 Tax=Phage sp. ctKtV17 TaxID=2825792 RepID=A0A8S5UYA7_9VIRU|nr:MAG TPA: hypothetical protein [Phage sp. ctKtV17]
MLLTRPTDQFAPPLPPSESAPVMEKTALGKAIG